MRNKIAAGFVAIIAILIIFSVFGAFFIVDEGERAVITTQGKVGGVEAPGFHTMTPFVSNAHVISIRTQVMEFQEEPVYTGDRQTATVTFSVNYAAIPTDDAIIRIYREYQTLEGMESRVLRRQIRENIKNIFGTFSADTAIRERGRLNSEVTSSIANIGGDLVKIEGVNIENINFSDAVEQAAEDRATAEMSTNTKKEEKKKAIVQNEIDVGIAQAQADSWLAKRKAEADGIRAIGEAEAASIKLKADAISANPNLIEYQKALTWNGALPLSMVPNATIPFMGISQPKALQP